jgi:hypothetical protein
MANRPSRPSPHRRFRINHLALALALLFTGADDHEAAFPILVRSGRVGSLHGIGSGFSGLGEQA